jgi:MFS family permease
LMTTNSAPATSAAPAEGQGEYARGWKALVASAMGIGLGMSPLPVFTAGIFAVALQHQFGWSRGGIMAAVFLQTVSLFVIGPPLGRLTDRIGARPVAIASTIGLGLSTAAFSLTTSNIWSFYAIYAVMSAVSVGTMPTTFAKVVSQWFDRRRGMALGLALCTTGIAGILLPLYVQSLIGWIGWRGAYVGLGLLPLVITLPCLLAFLPAGGPIVTTTLSPAATGMSVSEAVRRPRYWLLAALGLAAGIALSGIVNSLVPLLVDRGFTPGHAARLFSIYGLFLILGRITSGWLLDRFWAPVIGAIFLAAACAGSILLQHGGQNIALLIPAVMLIALSSGAEFDLCAYLTGRYFGARNFASLYAIQYAFFGLGAGIAPALFGHIHDSQGSYGAALLLAAALFAGSAVAILGLGRYPAAYQPKPQYGLESKLQPQS